MKILRIVYDWPDLNNITEGLAPAPYELSLAQTRLGHEVYVLCGNLNGRNLKAGKFSYDLADGKIHVYNLPRAIGGFGPFLSTSIFVLIYYFYLRLFRRIDIVHNHGHLGLWFLLYKSIFGFVDKIPVIGHFHITARGREKALIESGQKIDSFSKFFEYPLHKFSDFLMTKVCFHLVAVSRDIVHEVQTFYGVKDSNITILESGVDANRFSESGKKASLNFKNTDIIIGNGGRLSKRKNIDVLVSAVSLLPENYKLVLWGPWDEKFKPVVDRIISSKNMSHRVHYAGVVSYFDVDDYYRATDIFVLPSSYEGLPKVVLEALACGCKVIASGFSIDHELPELVLIKEVNEKSLADSIISASGKVKNREVTRKIVEKFYSWDSKALSVDEIMNTLVNR